MEMSGMWDGFYSWDRQDQAPEQKEYIGIRPDSVINIPKHYLGHKTYIVPPGIGDIAWVYSKLVALDEPMVFAVPGKAKIKEHAALALRSLPFIDLLPLVKYSTVANCEGGHVYIAGSISDYSNGTIPESPSMICFNYHLERGNKLESIMPGLGTQRHFAMKRPKWAMREAKMFLKPGEKAFAVYTSSSGYFSGQDLTISKWADTIMRVAHKKPSHKIVIVGASWDMGMLFPLYSTLCSMGLRSRVVMVHDREIATVLEILRACEFMIGAVSGLTIIAEYQGIPTVHIYPMALHRGDMKANRDASFDSSRLNLLGTWESPTMVRDRNSLSIPYTDYRDLYSIHTEFAPIL